MKDFKNYLSVSGYSRSTQKEYLKIILSMKEKINKSFKSINLNDLLKFLKRIKNNATYNKKVAAIKTFFKFYCNINRLVNPAMLLKFKKAEITEKEKTFLNITDLKKIISYLKYDSFKNSRNSLIFEFLYYTGARRAEITDVKNLDFKDLNFVEILGKGKVKRGLFLPEILKRKISIYQSFREKQKVFSNNLFVNIKGDEISGQSITAIIAKIFKRFGIVGTSHTIRRSVATGLIKKESLLNVKNFLGHTDLRSTQKYIKTNNSNLKNCCLNNL